ncbi:MAG: patatin-like phospholipase family protein [Candidatus Moduliflexus flocculans]|nr:patatin-like phospholipase family protein [Candidatus Moduliflexus flocculans]
MNENWKIDTRKHAFESQVGATDDLRYGMSVNPHMKVYLTHGVFDLVTPFFTAERIRPAHEAGRGSEAPAHGPALRRRAHVLYMGGQPGRFFPGHGDLFLRKDSEFGMNRGCVRGVSFESRFECIRAVFFALFLLIVTAGSAGIPFPLVRQKSGGGFTEPRSGTALIITGAAARIPQEAALIEALHSRGWLSDLVFISGVSSGALNAVALNGILSGRMTWERYLAILFSIKAEDIYSRNAGSLPVDTEPLRMLFRRVVEDELAFRHIGDLPIPTAITISQKPEWGQKTHAFRLCSRPINSESDPSIDLVDILCATTAIPLIFPYRRVPGASTIPDIEYVDGGASEDYVPFRSLLRSEKYRGRGVDRVLIISRKYDFEADLSEELSLLGVNDHRILDRLGVSFDRVADRKFRAGLLDFVRTYPDTAGRALVWRPDFPETYLMLDFHSMEAQYRRTADWAKDRSPVPVMDFLENGQRFKIPSN